MAVWCLMTRLGPDSYHALTRLERGVFIEVANEGKQKGWR